MVRDSRWIAPIAVVVVGLGVPLVYLAWRGLLVEPAETAQVEETARTEQETEEIARSAPGVRPVVLFFSDAAGERLVPERREVAADGSAAELARSLVEELASGSFEGHASTLPAGVGVRHVFLDDSGTLYLDFERALSQGHPGGTRGELLTLRSLAETVAANLPEVRGLRILVNGAEPSTLAGHVVPLGELTIPGRG